MNRLLNKIQTYNKYIEFYLQQVSFKEIYILSVILSIYGGLLSRVEADTISGIFNIFRFPTFLLCYYLLMILNVFSLCKFFDNSLSLYTMRKRKKKIILKDKINIVILINIYYSLLLFLLIISFVYLGHTGIFKVYEYENYGINNLLYLLYFFVRAYLLSTLILIINVTLYEKIKINCIFFDFIIFIGILLFPIKDNIKLSINAFNILKFAKFKTMAYDFFSSILCIFIFLIIEIIVFKLSYKENNYEIYNNEWFKVYIHKKNEWN